MLYAFSSDSHWEGETKCIYINSITRLVPQYVCNSPQCVCLTGNPMSHYTAVCLRESVHGRQRESVPPIVSLMRKDVTEPAAYIQNEYR